MSIIMGNTLTRDVCALVDVADGVAVLEAELLIQRVTRPSLTTRKCNHYLSGFPTTMSMLK